MYMKVCRLYQDVGAQSSVDFLDDSMLWSGLGSIQHPNAKPNHCRNDTFKNLQPEKQTVISFQKISGSGRLAIVAS